jgi:hypothetical protein
MRVGDRKVGSTTYQAPNRTNSRDGQMIVIGRTLYEVRELTQTGVVTEWGRTRLSSFDNPIVGPPAPKAQLRYLLNTSTAIATANGYDFQETIPINQVSPGSKGLVLIKGTATVNQKLVRKIFLAYFIDGQRAGADYTYTFTSFNRSRVAPPPAAKTVTLPPCIGPKTHKPSAGQNC